MKRYVSASINKAKVGAVIKKMKELLDAMEDLSDEEFNELELSELYDILIEEVPAASFTYKQL